MKKRKSFLILVATLIAALCFLFGACSSKIEFKFETNGGAEIAAVEVEKGETFTLPTPEREGYSFEGWYDNADLAGSAITSVVAEKSMTFYAKWEQMSALKLQLDGGTLPSSTLYLKAGENIYDHVKDLVPTKEGWQFGAWYLGGEELSHTATMPEGGAELTARYKVGYTVEIYEQNLEQTEYVKAAENVVGYEYITDTEFAPPVERTGFTLAQTAHQDEIRSRKLTEKMSENVYRLYFDRQLQTVIFVPNYPDGTQGESVMMEKLYGSEVEFPNAQFSVKGYFIAGWGVGGMESAAEVKYPSHYIETLVENGDGTAQPDKLVVDGEIVLFAIWSKGYTDMFRGSDFIYLFDSSADVCYLEREGKFFKGEYEQSGDFTFTRDNGDVLFGKLKQDGTFVYYMERRSDIVADYYEVGKEIDQTKRLFLDSLDGVIYSTTEGSSEGTYTIDDDDNYNITFTSGKLAGQTMTVRVYTARVNGSTRIIFQIRDEEEYAMPTLVSMVAVDGELNYYINNVYAIDLDGYGNATYNTGSEEVSYYYTREEDRVTLLNSDGSVYGEFFLVKMSASAGSIAGYFPYYEELDGVFTDENGATLTLDGLFNATYENGSTTMTGIYSSATSELGGTLITFPYEGVNQVFTVTRTQVSEEEETYEYSFIKRPSGYREYYYTNEETQYYTPFIVMDEAQEGIASIYGYTSRGEYKKVAEGPLVYNENERTYSLTVNSNIPYPNDIMRTPVDLEGIQNVVFGVGSARTYLGVIPVTYWYSMTKNGETGKTDYTKEYKGTYSEEEGGTEKEATLTLVNGFAILKIEGEEALFGGYAKEGNVTTLALSVGGETTTYYVELNEEDESFLFLHGFIGVVTELKQDGTRDSNVTIEFDGKGNAEYVIVTPAQDGAEKTETRLKGKAEILEEQTIFKNEMLRFTSEDGQTTFRFMLLTVGSNVCFARESSEYSGEYELDSTSFGSLKIDGFGFRAEYTAEDGTVYEGQYRITDENVVRFVDELNEVFLFDLKDGKKFTVRDEAYGDYLFVTNQAFDNYILHFDGYGNATLDYVSVPDSAGDDTDADASAPERDTVATGTYRLQEDGSYSVTLQRDGGTEFYIGRLDLLRISSSSYHAFFVEDTGMNKIFLDEDDWSMLKLDGCGNAVFYDEYGMTETGQYIAITETLLYYESDDATDAGIYSYNTAKGTISRKKSVQTAYYTAELDALLFSSYGYMIFNNEEQYFYNEAADGNVTIYLRDIDSDQANAYGFVPIEIGKFDEKKNFHDYSDAFVDADYYLATGYAISFKRAQDGKDDYPVLAASGDTEKYPLGELTFAPAGGEEFSVTARVNINGKVYDGTVYRETVEDADGNKTSTLYFLYRSTLRFDIEVTYNGDESAEYKVTQLRNVIPIQSNTYISSYALYYAFFGSSVANSLEDTIGEIEIITEYKKDGSEGETYITAEFGEDSPLFGYRLNKVPYTYDEDRGEYVVDLPDKSFEVDEDGKEIPPTQDTYKYRLHFRLTYNRYFSLLFGVRVAGYDLLAFTRIEVLETKIGDQDATVTVEHTVASDFTNFPVGGYYNVSIKVGETELEYELLLGFQGKVYFVVRTREETQGEDGEVTYGKITSSVYYVLTFTEADSGEVGNALKELESVAVEKYDTEVYYNSDGECVEVLKSAGEDGADTIIFFVHDGANCFVKECTYDEASKTYTVKTSASQSYSITVNETEKTFTITRIEEQD